MTYALTIEGVPVPIPTPTPVPVGKTYTITASAYSGGTVSPIGAVQVEEGKAQTFQFAPQSGYEITDVRLDGVWIGPRTSYTFTNVRTNHTIQVSFGGK